MNSSELSLSYRDSDGMPLTVEGCSISKDAAGRFWIWSEQLQHNLAYRAKTRDDALLGAIDSLLFTIQLRDERIAKLQRIADLAEQFADAVKPDDPEESL